MFPDVRAGDDLADAMGEVGEQGVFAGGKLDRLASADDGFLHGVDGHVAHDDFRVTQVVAAANDARQRASSSFHSKGLTR